MTASGSPEQGYQGGCNANRNERALVHSLLHGQDMGRTQNHRNGVEQRRLAVGGWRLAVGGPWGLSLTKKKLRF